MNELAKELNEILDKTIAKSFFSKMGERMYFPSKGIVAQSGEAKVKAHFCNATVGMAVNNSKPIVVPIVKDMLPNFTEVESVSYASSYGELELRKLWKDEIYRKNSALGDCQISLPVVVPGLTGGISMISDLFVDHDDYIVIPDMYWGNYNLIFEGKRDAKILKFPFFNDDGKMNLSGFKDALIEAANKNLDKNGGKLKVRTILNFPNNPTGYTPVNSEVEELKNIFLDLANSGYEIMVISDDAYFGLFYEDDVYNESLFGEFANLHENIFAVKIDGITKEHFAWGFRVGFVSFASKGLNEAQLKALEAKMGGNIRATVSNCSMIAQSIMIKALTEESYEAERKAFDDFLIARYFKVKDVLSKLSSDKLKPMSFNSGYFMSFVFDGDAEALRVALLDKYGIGTISIAGSYLRVAFSSVDIEDIEDMFCKIYELANSL